MAQYSDYLKYLNHVDDTTLQDFKVKEDVLLQEIIDTKTQCEIDIKAMEEKCRTELEKQKSAYEVKISEIKQLVKDNESSYRSALSKLKNDYEEEIKNKLFIEKARFTKELKKLTSELENCKEERDILNHKANMYETSYNEALSKLKSLSNKCFILRWIQCDKSDTHRVLILCLLLVVLAVGGVYYYNNVYVPEKIDREASRFYSFANSVVLRDSKIGGISSNKIASIPYGTELITYEIDDEWCKVKVDLSGEKHEGYIASPYVLNKADFLLLNSIWRDEDSRETVKTSMCRKAVLNYFKDRNYVGNISYDLLQDAGIDIELDASNQWQIFSRPPKMSPNSVFFKRLINIKSKFEDFAVLIKNIHSGERKLLYFYFDDDGTPYLAFEQDAPIEGFIKNVCINKNADGNRYLNVDYSNE